MYREGFPLPLPPFQALGETLHEGGPCCIRFLHDIEPVDPGEARLLQNAGHLSAGASERRKALVPQRPAVRLPFHQHQAARLSRVTQPFQALRHKLAFPLPPPPPFASPARRAAPRTRALRPSSTHFATPQPSA